MNRIGSDRSQRAWPGVAAGVAVSLLLHAVAGAWLVRSAGARPATPEIDPDLPATSPPPDPAERPIRLGQIDADRASITWLGVLEDPSRAEVPESAVDQAALNPNVGAAAPEQADQVTETPPPATEAQEPAPTPIEEPAASRTPEAPAAEPAIDPPPEPSMPETPSETASTPDPAPEVTEPDQASEITDAPPPGPSLVAAPSELAAPEQEPSDREPAPRDAVVGPPSPEPADREVPATQPEAPAPSEPRQEGRPERASPATAGERAVRSPRQSDASMRKRALEYRSDLNRPIAGKGLEIKTVRPQWPVTVRQSYRPGNPHVLIHFGGDGRARRVSFIREADGSRGTGIAAVDQPLVDALYRWTAKGPQIDALVASDPDDVIAIPIRILLSRR
ncbi:MAG: hypothetical protein AAGA55_07110 [Planctomycetota bacterium]